MRTTRPLPCLWGWCISRRKGDWFPRTWGSVAYLLISAIFIVSLNNAFLLFGQNHTSSAWAMFVGAEVRHMGAAIYDGEPTVRLMSAPIIAVVFLGVIGTAVAYGSYVTLLGLG